MLRNITKLPQILSRTQILTRPQTLSRTIKTTPATLDMFQRKFENETREIKAKRLLWQSRKRGISENDLLLSTWFKEAEPEMSDEDLDTYSKLINSDVNEWDLFYWISKTKPVPEEYDTKIMHSLQKHCQNDKREERFFQPGTENSKSV